MKNGNKGFTLLEIIIAVSIISLLVVFGTVSVQKSMKQRHVKRAEIELELIAAGTMQLVWDTGKWPNGIWRNKDQNVTRNEVWDLTGSALFRITDENEYPNWRGPYYEGSLEDPWGNPYFFDSDYRVDGVNRVVVGSAGPNGRGRNIYDKDNIYVLVDK